MLEWPKGEQPGPACPEYEAGDLVTYADTQGCEVKSLYAGMCPCAAILGGWDTEWCGYDEAGNLLPRHVERSARRQLDALTQALVDDIMALSDEEILSEDQQLT